MTSMLKASKTKILLSLNAAAILIAGVIIAGAIWIPKETTLRVVAERDDSLGDSSDEFTLIESVNDYLQAAQESGNTTGGSLSETISNLLSANEGGGTASTPATDNNGGGSSDGGNTTVSSGDAGAAGAPAASGSSSSGAASSVVIGSVSDAIAKASSGDVPSGELWNETSLTIYQTADVDICVDSSLNDLGDMYWQTSNTGVIEGFYSSARTRLGYDPAKCRFPKVSGTGTTTITAGTYDGLRRDTLTVTVIAVPLEEWKRDVLTLVNRERANNGLGQLTWGTTCEAAAMVRAREIISVYAHTRPDGSKWSTACPIPATGGSSGENLAAGNTTVSPETVVTTWMNSPSHRENILNPTFTKLSVGFVFDPGTQYKTYWSQIFTTY